MYWLWILSLNIAEVLFAQVHEHLVLNLACADNNHVLAEVIRRMEVDDHIPRNTVDVVNITQDWLAHHVLSVNVVVDVFHECFFRVLVHLLKLCPNSVFLSLVVLVIVD